MHSVPDNILRRIAALRAMSLDTSSENEAMLAASRLHKLLIKYQISIDEVGQTDDVSFTELRISKKDFGAWSRIIADAVSKLYFCKMYYTAYTGFQVFTIVGSNTHRQLAVQMVNTITRAVDRQARANAKDMGGNAWSYITSFRKSASSIISRRCQEMIRDGKNGELADGEGGTFPVLADMYASHESANDALIQKRAKIQIRKQTSSAADHRGASHGSDFGATIPLTQALGQVAPRKPGVL